MEGYTMPTPPAQPDPGREKPPVKPFEFKDWAMI